MIVGVRGLGGRGRIVFVFVFVGSQRQSRVRWEYPPHVGTAVRNSVNYSFYCIEHTLYPGVVLYLCIGMH